MLAFFPFGLFLFFSPFHFRLLLHVEVKKKKKHFLQSQTVRKIGWVGWFGLILVGWCMGCNYFRGTCAYRVGVLSFTWFDLSSRLDYSQLFD